jgi:hypothetical protein
MGVFRPLETWKFAVGGPFLGQGAWVWRMGSESTPELDVASSGERRPHHASGQPHGVGKPREPAGWKACPTPIALWAVSLRPPPRRRA